MNEIPSADLVIVLSKLSGTEYSVEMRFDAPDQEVERPIQRGKARIPVQMLSQRCDDPVEYGRSLFQALLNSDLQSAFQFFGGLAQEKSLRLRLRLMIDRSAPELHDLCWETLCLPAGPDSEFEPAEHLATNQNVIFSRFLTSSDWATIELRPRGRLRALLAVANPAELKDGYRQLNLTFPEVNVEAEVSRARRALRLPDGKGLEEDQIAVLAGPPIGTVRVTLENLAEMLNDGPGYDILYLVCHGMLAPDDPDEDLSPVRPYLLLEDPNGSVDQVRGEQLLERISELSAEKRPRLVVLASCQSAGAGPGGGGAGTGGGNPDAETFNSAALASLGPRLVEIGVPAVIAMQANVKIRTIEAFMPQFFRGLLRTGQVDLAMAEARSAVRRTRDDWWVPVLYLRLRRGKLWYQTGFSDPRLSGGLWAGIIRGIQEGKCTPVLGSELLETLDSPPRQIAFNWAEKFFFPLAPHDKQNVPQVAQFLSNRAGPQFPRDEFVAQLKKAVLKRYPQFAAPALPLPDLLKAVYLADPDAPQFRAYNLLARLPFSIYITANPDTLLAEAIRRKRGSVQELYFCWKPGLVTSQNFQASQNLVEPSYDNPLVYHLFGSIRDPNSLVLTEDDFFDFLMWVNREEQQQIQIPRWVTLTWLTKALLFLGFRMDDWNFRVLFRSILDEGRRRERRKNRDDIGYKSVAVQIQPGDDYLRPDQAQNYLEDIFTSEDFNIFWGSASQFLDELEQQWTQEVDHGLPRA